MSASQRSLWYNPDRNSVSIIDQRCLPQSHEVVELVELEQFCSAISDMQVRGAPLIGITAAYGLALAISRDPGDDALGNALTALLATRPTAVNLAWALGRVKKVVEGRAPQERAGAALEEAHRIAEEEVANCRAIGDHGLALLQEIAARRPGETLHVMTHCNAGWLAVLEWGTALAPVYRALEEGLAVHVWVSETRPRNQGLDLTAWELQQAGVEHTVIADNAAGYLMQQGRVDCCLVGSDRTAANGDVCNKVGTYLKALAAQAHSVPFYVALPTSTIELFGLG